MAIPFDAPTGPHEFQNRQPIQHPTGSTFTMVENLLQEILTLVRWAPIWALHDAAEAPMAANLRTERRRAAHRSRLVREHHERQQLQREQEQQAQQPMQQHPWLQQPLQQQQPLEQNGPIGQPLEQHHSLHSDQGHHHNHGHERQQQMPQQQLPLPDLIPSFAVPESVPSIVVPAVEVKTEEKPPANTLTLQVELCPECYQNGRILKVVGVSELVQNGDNDGEESTIVSQCSKVKQRIMSLLQPTNIDSSLLTAVFVIVGWKMFIKQ